jgi:predicted porin
MNRKVMAAAVAAAFVAPAAIAQTTVTIGGTINIMYDTVKANDATRNVATMNNSFNMLSHDRVRDGAGSNIRFFVGEELGGGNQAFIQVESAVVQNSDQRTNMVGATGFSSATGNAAPVWGNRNTAIGLRSKTWGRFLIGVWDLHYDEMYGIEPGWLIANSASSALAVWQNFGSAISSVPGFIGSRYSNTIRWDSPNWSGFSMTLGYSRPVDTPPLATQGTGVGGGDSVIHGQKNRAWHLAARYERGGLQVRYAYLQDRNAATTATLTWAGLSTLSDSLASTIGTSNWKVRSHRVGVRYRFAMGLGIGFVWDSSRVQASHENGSLTVQSTDVKRRSWAIPVTYETGNHGFYGTYGRARDWRGSIAGCGVGDSVTAACQSFTVNADLGVADGTYDFGKDTGSKFWTLGYTYRLSQRTNVHLSYYKLTNDPLALYNSFANVSGIGAANAGSDPRSWAVGFRHTF